MSKTGRTGMALSLAAAWLLSLIPGVRFITLGERK